MPGILCADLAQALAELKKRNPNWTDYKIHKEILRNPLRYAAPENFSITAVKHAIGGHKISPRTRDVMAAFVRSLEPELLPPVRHECDLDIATFFYVMGPELPKAADALVGDYQTYARSTTAEGYVRRGRITATYDAKRWRLKIAETQYRPPIDGHLETEIQWEGFIAPKNEYYYALMRTTADAQDATPMLTALRPLLRDGNTGRIRSLAAYAMHFEPERGCFMTPTIYMERCAPEDIKLDFVPMHDVTSGVVRTRLGLGERIEPATTALRLN